MAEIDLVLTSSANRSVPQAGNARARDLWMPLSDGSQLATRVWFPVSDTRTAPVLLMRQPYGREIASTVTLAHPSWYTAQGYIVAVQDVRGTGASEGAFDPFSAESSDGAKAVDWARELPGSNGKIGLYGFSYQGMTQLLALAGGGRPDAVAPVMSAWDLWEDFASDGGAFRLEWGICWAMQMGANAAKRAGDGVAFEAFTIAPEPHLADRVPALPDLTATNRQYTHLADWVDAIGDDQFWRERSPSRVEADAPESMKTPALFVGGWFDTFLNGTIKAHTAFADTGAPTQLVIGPWGHIPWQGGELSIDRLIVAWFDRHLKDKDGLPDEPPIRLWDLTQTKWRGFSSWPDQSTRLWLEGDGLAAAASTGRLTTDRPAIPLTETFVHDPWRPVPARGHNLAAPVGMVDRTDLDARADVAVFTSPPQDTSLAITGPITLGIEVETDAESFDLHAVLSLVDADGQARTLSVGHLRHTEPASACTIALRRIAATVPPGQRLRLSISGAAWPAYAVNPGTGASPETTPGHLRRPITITLKDPACLDLGVAP